jgi:uncharacterized membrane protein HdeD (DUF308 family)
MSEVSNGLSRMKRGWGTFRESQDLKKDEEMLTALARGWWILTLRGVVALFYALAALVWFEATPIILLILLSMYAFVDGVLGVISAFENHEYHGQRAVLLSMGLVGIAAGLATLFWPKPNVAEFVYLIAVWALVAGILETIAGIRLYVMQRGTWLLAVKGGTLTILGLLLLLFGQAQTHNTHYTHYLVISCVAALGALSIVISTRLGNWPDN